VLLLFLVSVCVLSLPDLVNLERHSDDFAQMAWNRIKRDIFRESPSAPQKYVGLPPPTINKVIGNSEKESIIVHVYI
jgi:hypothetical protein